VSLAQGSGRISCCAVLTSASLSCRRRRTWGEEVDELTRKSAMPALGGGSQFDLDFLPDFTADGLPCELGGASLDEDLKQSARGGDEGEHPFSPHQAGK
jgi:hypothetical protein